MSALKSAKCVLALTTERGLARKWVWFELGRTWFSDVRLIPCCIGKLRKHNLPAPFSDRMALNIDEERDAFALFESLRKQFGPNGGALDISGFVNTMTRLDIRAEERAEVQENPYVNELMRGIEKKMKSLSAAERETVRLFAIYGELSTGAARALAKESGADMNKWSVPDHLIRLTGWLTPSAGNTPYDDMEKNVYSINQTICPLIRAYFSQVKEM